MIHPPTKQDITNALWGCLELPIFMKQGVTRFGNDWRSVRWSFWIPVLLLPVAAMIPDSAEYGNKPYLWTLAFFALITAMGMALFFTFLYFVIELITDRSHLLQFVTAYNWLNITSFALQLPFLLLAMTGVFTWKEMYNILVYQMLYGYVVEAFLVTHMFRIHWFLGVAIAVADMLCINFAHKLVLGWMT